MNDYTTYVAMDVHKKQHYIAMILPTSNLIKQWSINNNAREIKRMVKQIKKKAPENVVFCYEAGVCGFGLQRQITAMGPKCIVIAPSLVPFKPGERVKTDRRDAIKLAKFLKAGLLTEVHPPNEKEESVRDLCRCRQSAQEDLCRIRHQVSKFLLRRGYIYSEGNNWTQKHLRWIRAINFEYHADKITFAEYLCELQHRIERVTNLNNHIETVSVQEPYCKAVGWLRCFCGIDTLTAMTIVTELHGFERFESASRLMGYLGLTPSEDSSGDRQKKGSITKVGNSRVRKALIESSWHQRHKPVASQALSKRRKGQEQWVIDIAKKCHKRLYQRYWYLINKGKSPNKVVTAIAREFVGFIWDVLHTSIEIAHDEEAA